MPDSTSNELQMGQRELQPRLLKLHRNRPMPALSQRPSALADTVPASEKSPPPHSHSPSTSLQLEGAEYELLVAHVAAGIIQQHWHQHRSAAGSSQPQNQSSQLTLHSSPSVGKNLQDAERTGECLAQCGHPAQQNLPGGCSAINPASLLVPQERRKPATAVPHASNIQESAPRSEPPKPYSSPWEHSTRSEHVQPTSAHSSPDDVDRLMSKYRIHALQSEPRGNVRSDKDVLSHAEDILRASGVPHNTGAQQSRGSCNRMCSKIFSGHVHASMSSILSSHGLRL
jgi:hypothetical protein